MAREVDAVTAQRLLDTRKALSEDKMVVSSEMQRVVEEILSAPLTLTGLVDFSSLCEEAISFARSAGMVFGLPRANEKEASPDISCRQTQSALFELFAKLFGALTGRAADGRCAKFLCTARLTRAQVADLGVGIWEWGWASRRQDSFLLARDVTQTSPNAWGLFRWARIS